MFVEVDNSEQDQPLLPGTFVHARIDGPVLSDALMVPRDALVRDSVFLTAPIEEAATDAPSGDEPEVEIADNIEFADIPDDARIAVRRPVTLARTIQTFALIEDGLAAGDQLIITNLDRLVDGRTLVRPQGALTVEEELDRQRIEALRLAK